MDICFKLMPNFNTDGVKKNPKMIQILNKQIHKLISG